MSKISILAFSDIHNNVNAVEALREQEKGGFDVIIIAGDMGSEKAKEILDIVSDYDCPVLYVYGNWDSRLSYSEQITLNAIHLHQRSISINGYTFAGFSGCRTHWGQNPVAQELYLNVKNDFSEHLKTIDDCKKEIKKAAQPFNAEIEYMKSLIVETANESVRYLKTLKGKDRNQIHKKTKEIEKVIALNERKIELLSKPYDKLLKSKKHKNYNLALAKAHIKAEFVNREILVSLLKNTVEEFSKTFLITHERLYKTHEDIPSLFCHIFGHRHGFKHTLFKETNFINVSALDNNSLWGGGENTYCVLDVSDGNLDVQCKVIKSSYLFSEYP